MSNMDAIADQTGALAANSLLSTKLFIPQGGAQRELLARPRLVQRLMDGVTRKLTLISAPAGYGKTMLMAELIPQCERPVAWLSLEETDNDLNRFWTYLIAALRTLRADFGQAILTVIQGAIPPPLEHVVTALVNDIRALGAFALVLDDYHLIHLPAIHAAINLLINHLPLNMHLFLLGRADPPLPLARLRVRNQMNELRAADLRFTLEEVTLFLQQVKGLPLPAAQIQELEKRTEGWSAGLHLAALSLQGLAQADMARFISDFTGTHHNIFDYLAEEVLQQQPAAVQRFLLDTSILSRLCAPLCDTLLSVGENEAADRKTLVSIDRGAFNAFTNSWEVLLYLERANLFLVPLDGQRHWYRYHHLFAEFLRNRLLRERDQVAVRALYQRTSGWFEQNRLFNEAIDCAFLGQDFERAARLVDSHSTHVHMQGELATLLRWLTALPDAAFEMRPALALNHAYTLAVLDQFAAAERRLDAAERTLQAAPEPDVDLRGQAAMVRAVIAHSTERSAEVTIAACQQALALLPPRSTNWRRMTGLFLGVAYYAQAGNLQAAYQTLLETEQVSLENSDPFGALHNSAHMTIALEIGGQLRASEQRSRESIRRSQEPFWQGVPLAAYAGFSLGRVLYERNELLAARDLLIPSIQQLEAWSLKRPLLIALVVLARVQQALGEPLLARTALARIVDMVQQDDLKQTYSYWAEYRVRMALAQGELHLVTKWANEIAPTIQGDLDPAQEFSHITLAQVYLAQGRPDDAQHRLDRLLPTALADERRGRVLEIFLLQALTADAQGQRSAALLTLERALTLAEPEDYIRTFVDLGPPMAALLHVAHTRTSRPAYTAKLLAAFPADTAAVIPPVLPPATATPLPSAFSRPPLVEPLSKRELEILQLLAQGYTNPEIAQKIYISAQTVKVHTRNIFGKLGVNDRKQAVTKARSLGLIP